MKKQTKMEYYYSLIETLVESITTEHHAVLEHGYKTDEVLKTRVSVEKVEAASCFNFDKEKVIDIIVDTIYDDVNLLTWMKSSVTEDYLITSEYEACGRKFMRSGSHVWEKDGAIICNKCRVILKKEHDISGALVAVHLVTAFPC